MEYSVDRDGDIVAISGEIDEYKCYADSVVVDSTFYGIGGMVPFKRHYVNYDSRFSASLLDILLGVE